MLTSFLVQCNQTMSLTNTFWYQPSFLISPLQKSLTDLFEWPDQDRVVKAVRQAFKQQENVIFDQPIKMARLEMEIALYLMPVGTQMLVCGHAISEDCRQDVRLAIQDMVFKFMNVIRSTDNVLILDHEKTIREQFEHIQKLNNNLINVQRQLQKTNVKLQQLNQDLNNRLVKDALTGLVSRYQYREEIESAIAQAPEKLGIFIFIDIDDFKSINDTYGHRAGDDFLVTFADRLRQLPFLNLICMRIAGDEFGLYLHGYNRVETSDLASIWSAITRYVLDQPIEIQAACLHPICSVGMAIYGQDTRDIYDLIEYADFAMYEAKRSGKNTWRSFDKTHYLQLKS